MKREILKTGDGSSTINIPALDEQYHSKHGAIAEAKHVFIQTGLAYYQKKTGKNDLRIIEIGFGTGLNAFLTLLYATNSSLQIAYTGAEAYPVILDHIKQLNYPDLLNAPREQFLTLHTTAWELLVPITENFSLKKQQIKFEDISEKQYYDIVYYDAFGARVQPELWEEPIFKIMYNALMEGGVLVTYAAKGSARRAMEAVGFKVERLPGPPGKREMLRATKC